MTRCRFIRCISAHTAQAATLRQRRQFVGLGCRRGPVSVSFSGSQGCGRLEPGARRGPLEPGIEAKLVNRFGWTAVGIAVGTVWATLLVSPWLHAQETAGPRETAIAALARLAEQCDALSRNDPKLDLSQQARISRTWLAAARSAAAVRLPAGRAGGEEDAADRRRSLADKVPRDPRQTGRRPVRRSAGGARRRPPRRRLSPGV